MLNLKTIKKTITFSIFVFLSQFSFGQNDNISIEQSEKITAWNQEKIKANNINNSNDRYKIQIFSGDNTNSRRLLTEFKSNYKNIDATIIFQTPNYKVLVGSFFNRIEAVRFLEEIKTTYPNSFIIKPSK
jgi:hypothetical protein